MSHTPYCPDCAEGFYGGDGKPRCNLHTAAPALVAACVAARAALLAMTRNPNHDPLDTVLELDAALALAKGE